jgi:branched-chain amino acid transport system permease protein
MSQAIINGILTGGLYAAFGIGLSLIYGVTRVISAVHGAFIVIGAYLAQTAWSWLGLDPFLMVPVLIVVGFCLGYFVQRVFIDPVMRQRVIMTITLTFGLDLIVVTAILLVFGADLRTVNVPYASAGFDFLGARVPIVRLGIFLVAVVMAVGLELFLGRTHTGTRIRAVSQNRVAADLLGIDTSHTYGVAHGLAAGVACGAGALVALIQPLQPFMGFSLLLIAFAVVVLAGFGSIAPVLVSGILLGLTENLAGLYIGTEVQRLSIFVAYLAVATVLPAGLFGRRFYAH